MRIGTRQFSGERPKLSDRLLGDTEATLAIDCELVSGELRAMYTNRVVRQAEIPGARTLFILDDAFHMYAGDVDVVETPVDAAVRRLFITGDGPPKQLDVESGTTYRLGVPKPVNAPVVREVTGEAPAAALNETSLYRFTYLNRWNEEGDASPPSDLFEYRSGQTMTVANLGDQGVVDLDEYAVVATRLYRLVEGESKFVGEYPITQKSAKDSRKASEAGEVYTSEDFYLPPASLAGLHAMATGVFLGFVGQKVYVSEPDNPNAWPYSFEVSDDIVAISSFDNYAVVLTTGYHEIAAIFDPRNISTTQLNEREPCVAKRGVVQGLGGVLFPAPSGLFLIGGSGGRMLTQDYLDEGDWQALRPETFTASYRDGEYIAFFGNGPGNGGGWVFDSREGNAVVRRLSQWASAAYVRDGTDDLHLVRDSLIELYQGGSERLTYRWRSKVFGPGSLFAQTVRQLHSPDFLTNPTPAEQARDAQRVETVRQENAERLLVAFDTMPSAGTLGALGQATFGAVTFGGDQFVPAVLAVPTRTARIKVYGEQQLIHDEEIMDHRVGRLNYADRKRYWQAELSGDATLTQWATAGSGSELHTGS